MHPTQDLLCYDSSYSCERDDSQGIQIVARWILDRVYNKPKYFWLDVRLVTVWITVVATKSVSAAVSSAHNKPKLAVRLVKIHVDSPRVFRLSLCSRVTAHEGDTRAEQAENITSRTEFSLRTVLINP